MPSDASSDADLRLELKRLQAQLAREHRARRHRKGISQMAAKSGGEVTRHGVAEVIAEGARAIFDCGWVMVAFVGEDDTIQLVHGPGVPADIVEDWPTAPLEAAIPIADVLRGGVGRLALTSREEFEPWPIMVAEADRANVGSLFIEAISGPGHRYAAVVLAWPDAHRLEPVEQDLLDELVEVACPAFERAIHTEADSDLVTTLQKWLMPSDLVGLDGVDLATMYEAGRETMEVGGDWYDIVEIDEDRSAIVIGDVVGHDVRAVAEMAQVRHVLAAYLLSTGDPAESLTLTDRYFHRREFNTMATALVVLFHSDSATVDLASAGHLAPMHIRPGEQAVAIDVGLGPPLGSGLGGFDSTVETLTPGSMLIAYTDGVVELRDETIDTSIAAFRNALDDHMATRPDSTVDAVIDMLRSRVHAIGSKDDAAAIALRVHGPPTFTPTDGSVDTVE